MTQLETLSDNARWPEAQPRLSVLIPFFRDNPVPLLEALAAQGEALGAALELIALDDGGGDAALAQRVAEAVERVPVPARFVGLAANGGRARARNRLAHHARSERFLFQDADTLPHRPDFLRRWLEASADPAPGATFGGFRVDRAVPAPETALHRALAARSDCLPAAERRLHPAKYIFTNNLMVRREVFETERFDERFTGWGWEDVEWGVRVGRRWPVAHIDNPVQNDRLDTVDGLMTKYRQAAPNFARILAAHPDVVTAFPAYRAARVLKRTPLRRPLVRLMAGVARSPAAPLRLRELALKTYRAGLYAEVV